MARMQQFCVIGLGRFGTRVATGLSEQGHDVVAMDTDPARVQQIRDHVTTAVVADATNEQALRELNVHRMDVVVVAIGRDIEASILVTALLKQIGCRRIVARASTDLHRRILHMVGADEVVYPEQEVAHRMVLSLSQPRLREFIQAGPQLEFVQLEVPRRFQGKTLAELDVRRNYGVNIVAVIPKGSDHAVTAEPQTRLSEGDVIWVAGPPEAVEALASLD